MRNISQFGKLQTRLDREARLHRVWKIKPWHTLLRQLNKNRNHWLMMWLSHCAFGGFIGTVSLPLLANPSSALPSELLFFHWIGGLLGILAGHRIYNFISVNLPYPVQLTHEHIKLILLMRKPIFNSIGKWYLDPDFVFTQREVQLIKKIYQEEQEGRKAVVLLFDRKRGSNNDLAQINQWMNAYPELSTHFMEDFQAMVDYHRSQGQQRILDMKTPIPKQTTQQRRL